MSIYEDTHGHSHAYSQDEPSHGHSHARKAAQAASPEELLALLEYMLSHNEHHTEELHALAHEMPENAAHLLHEAISEYGQGNAKLVRAVKLLKEG